MISVAFSKCQYLEFSKGSHHKRGTKTELEGYVVLDGRAEVYSLHISLYSRCWDYVVAIRSSPLWLTVVSTFKFPTAASDIDKAGLLT